LQGRPAQPEPQLGAQDDIGTSDRAYSSKPPAVREVADSMGVAVNAAETATVAMAVALQAAESARKSSMLSLVPPEAREQARTPRSVSVAQLSHELHAVAPDGPSLEDLRAAVRRQKTAAPTVVFDADAGLWVSYTLDSDSEDSSLDSDDTPRSVRSRRAESTGFGAHNTKNSSMRPAASAKALNVLGINAAAEDVASTKALKVLGVSAEDMRPDVKLASQARATKADDATTVAATVVPWTLRENRATRTGTVHAASRSWLESAFHWLGLGRS